VSVAASGRSSTSVRIRSTHPTTRRSNSGVRRHPVRHPWRQTGDRLIQRGGQLGIELLPQRPPLALEQLVEEAGHRLVEGGADRRSAEPLCQILGRQQPLADRAPDAPGQSRLVLGDRALNPERADAAGVVGVKQHPDGDGIGDPAGDGAHTDGHQGLDPQLPIHQ
jgi:hypothetical protein